MTISVHQTNKPIRLEELSGFPTHSISVDWNGDPLGVAVTYTLVKAVDTFWFRCLVPLEPSFDSTLTSGQFVEGLWERDVVEFFILDPESGEYHECNVGPTGAWWWCDFPEYRVRAVKTYAPELAGIFGEHKPGTWEGAIGLKLPDLDLRRVLIHVAAIHYGPTTRYISSHPVPGIEPDFHHADCFQDVGIVEV